MCGGRASTRAAGAIDAPVVERCELAPAAVKRLLAGQAARAADAEL